MTERTTDPDAGRLEERLRAHTRGMMQHQDPLTPVLGRLLADLTQAADTLAALRERAEHWEQAWMQASEAETDAVRRAESAEERAERAQEQYERAMSIIREDELEDLTEQRDRLRAALEGARALVKSAWCEGHNIGLGDGHPLAGPPHRWEDSDACADLAALSDSPAPEVRSE